MRLKIILISFLVSSSFCASANNYFVSPSGRNSNSGSFGSPFKTIKFSLSKLKAGDTLFLREGTYNEIVSINGIAGVSIDKPLVVSAYNEEDVLIDGKGLNVGAGSALVRTSVNFTRIIGLTIINSNQSGIMLDMEAPCSKVLNCVVHDVWETGIYGFADFCEITGCSVYNAAMSNSDGIYSPPEYWGGGISCRRTSESPVMNCTISKCIVHDVWGEGIDMAFADWGTIEENNIYDIYSALLYSRNNQHMIIQRNFMHMSKKMGDGDPVGIAHWNEGSYSFINKNNTIINNIVLGCKRNLYHYGGCEGLFIANNTFVNSTYFASVQIDNRAEMSDCIFKNNIVIQDNSLQPIWVESGEGLIFNNNLYNKSSDKDAVGKGDIIGNPAFISVIDASLPNLTPEVFMLSVNSPAIDKGVEIDKVIDDFSGYPRDNKPDIGAMEYYSEESSIKIKEIKIKVVGVTSTVKTGTYLQMIAEISPSNASNKSVRWSISDGIGKAVISPGGIVYAIKPGMITVKVQSMDGSGVSGKYEILIILSANGLNQMIIYPNPAKDHFRFTLQDNSPGNLIMTISSLSGKILIRNKIESELGELIIPEDIPDGMYIIYLCSGEVIYNSQKLVIAN